jgi:GntR family transcriptional regulator
MTTSAAFPVEELGALDPSSFVPLYMQLATSIAGLIREHGQLAVGKSLPSETDCVEHLGVSRPTVRQAMAHLLSQGLILRQKGRGTFVAPLKLEHDVSHGFEDEMRAAHHSVQYSVLDWQLVSPPAEVAGVFGSAPDTRYYRLRRTRSVEGKVVGVEERYLPQAIGELLSRQDLEAMPVLALLHNLTGRKPGRQDIEVSSAGADPALAKALHVKRGAPLLLRTTTFRDAGGQALLHGTVTFLAEHYRFRFSVSYSA